MKKLSASVILAVIAILVGSLTAQAAGISTTYGPYQGIFSGGVSGDRGSEAPITLDLIQRGEDISGTVSIGEGLYIDGGVCGAVAVPAAEQAVTGKTVKGHPDQLDTKLSFNVSNIKIVVNLASRISADGKNIEAEARIDLPWLCGRDPVIRGELERED
jgi:hypothetical protein